MSAQEPREKRFDPFASLWQDSILKSKQGVRLLCGLLFVGVGAFGVSGAGAAEKEGLTTVVINGEQLTNVTRVAVGSGGKVAIIQGMSGRQVSPDQLPPGFLQSWGITETGLAESKQQAADQKQQDLERAIKGGKFRVVAGIVYDLRKPQAGWVSVARARILQHLGHDELLVDTTPDSVETEVIHLKNLPGVAFLSDRDYVSFTAKLVSNYSYETRAHLDRTIRSYDSGTVCNRGEIPDAILVEGKAWAARVSTSVAVKNPVAELPGADKLAASGSGFFITEDGYLLTNDHVVKGYRRVRVRTKAGDLPASVIRRSESDDLALLKVDGHFSSLALNLVKESALGDEVFTIGFPNVRLQGLQPKYTDGKISSLAGIRDDPSQYQVSVQVQPGNSGGPLVDAKRRVVGVIVARISDMAALALSGSLPQNVNYAVKASTVREFLKPAKELEGKLKPNSYELGKDQAIKAAEEATAMVLCYE